MFDDPTHIVEAIILGVIQGFTEFLPISSSAHLMLLPKLAHLPYFGKTFDVILHGGTLLAICFYKWDLLKRMLVSLFKYGQECWQRKKFASWHGYGSSDLKLALLTVVAAVPVAVLGFALENTIEHFFHSLLFTALTLAIFGLWLYKADKRGTRSLELGALSFKEAICIGVAQALALFPGVSRSGVVLTAARLLNIPRLEAGTISLVTALPVVGGAFFVKIWRLLRTTASFEPSFLFASASGFLSSFIAGLIGIMLLEKVISQYTFKFFAFYRIGLALILLAMWATT